MNRKLKKVAPCLYRHYLPALLGTKDRFVGSYFAYYWQGGVQIKFSLKTEDFNEARRLLREKRARLDKLDPTLRSLTLRTACDKYLEGRTNLSTATQRRDREIVKRIGTGFPGGLERTLRTIKTSDFEGFLAGMRQITKKRATTSKPLSVGYRNKIGGAIRSIFDLAVLDEAIDKNPASRFKYKTSPEPKRLTPTWQQFLKIVETIRSEPNRTDCAMASADWIEFSGRAGLGAAEINNLKWTDVDFRAGEMFVRRLKSKRHFKYTLHPLVIPFLNRLRERVGVDLAGPIFHVASPRKAFAHACKKLEYPAYEPRCLRRLHITFALDADIPADIVAQNQGHRDGGRLARLVYYTIRPKFVRAQFAKLKEPAEGQGQ